MPQQSQILQQILPLMGFHTSTVLFSQRSILRGKVCVPLNRKRLITKKAHICVIYDKQTGYMAKIWGPQQNQILQPFLTLMGFHTSTILFSQRSILRGKVCVPLNRKRPCAQKLLFVYSQYTNEIMGEMVAYNGNCDGSYARFRRHFRLLYC